jgi:hypothetical protein
VIGKIFDMQQSFSCDFVRNGGDSVFVLARLYGSVLEISGRVVISWVLGQRNLKILERKFT